MVDVNLMGPIHVIEELVPPMVEAGRGGHLVNVSSAAGIIGMPWHAAYSASKFGLRGVSEVLRFDLARHGIGVSLVCPGAVHTPLTETVQIAGVDTTGPRFRKLQARFHERAVSPEEAADGDPGAYDATGTGSTPPADIRLDPPGAANAARRRTPLAMRVMNSAANRVLPEVGQARRVDA